MLEAYCCELPGWVVTWGGLALTVVALFWGVAAGVAISPGVGGVIAGTLLTGVETGTVTIGPDGMVATGVAVGPTLLNGVTVAGGITTTGCCFTVGVGSMVTVGSGLEVGVTAGAVGVDWAGVTVWVLSPQAARTGNIKRTNMLKRRILRLTTR